MELWYRGALARGVAWQINTMGVLLVVVALALLGALVIFLLVATITIFNYRFTRSWEETSRNV